MEDIEFRWADGNDDDFRRFYLETEKYYNLLMGGSANRAGFIPYNLSESIPTVLIAVCSGKAVGCVGLKPYSDQDGELKRVWIDPDYRGRHIAASLMDRMEDKAREMKYKRIILQTRPIMKAAVHLYQNRGYRQIANYPPYDKLDGAICMALAL